MDSLVHDSYVKDNSIEEFVPIKLKHMTESIVEAKAEAKAFKPISKTPEEKTSYKVNQKLLLVSLCAMALIGSTYYWMDDRTDVWEISMDTRINHVVCSNSFCNSICETKSQTGISHWRNIIMDNVSILAV